jgi:hypothetical protein
MEPKRKIKAKDIVSDIRSGMSDLQLMQKHRLSSKGLQSVFRKLVEAKVIRPRELFNRAPTAGDDTVDVTSIRLVPRDFVEVSLPICDADDPKNIGTITNVTEQGLGIRGIRVATGEIKTLVFFSDRLFPVGPFALQAQCRWVKNGNGSGQLDSGFEITNISETSSQQLKKVVEWVALRD